MWQFLWAWSSQHWPLSLYVVRSAPFVAYACFARRTAWPLRLVLAGVFAALVAFAVHAGNGEELRALAAVSLYFFAGASAIHGLRRALPYTAIRGGAVLAIAALLFVVAPAVLARGAGSAVAIVLGWDLMLSSHSYCVDTRATGARPTLAQGLFFLLVNPILVYANRGEPAQAPKLRVAAVLRILLGAVCILGRDFSLRALGLVAWLRESSAVDGDVLTGYARFCAVQLVLVVGLYAAHSGLASLQIGWMQILGVRLPERYRYPLFATSPRDFWARWNTWVGAWAHRYLFLPTAHRLVRRGSRAGGAAAAAVTFACIGLLHDLAPNAGSWNPGHPSPSLRFTALFLAFGCVYLAWDAVARLAERRRSSGARLVRVRAFASWALCLQLICAFGWLGMPVVRAHLFPPPIERAISGQSPRRIPSSTAR